MHTDHTTPYSPYLGGIEGSRAHHWLATPSLVTVFRRAGVLATTLCLVLLFSPPFHHKGELGTSLK